MEAALKWSTDKSVDRERPQTHTHHAQREGGVTTNDHISASALAFVTAAARTRKRERFMLDRARKRRGGRKARLPLSAARAELRIDLANPDPDRPIIRT